MFCERMVKPNIPIFHYSMHVIMRAVIQRVRSAEVHVDGRLVERSETACWSFAGGKG